MLDLQKLKYVIFDWDNTLAETRTALITVVNQVLAEYGMACWDIVKKRRDPDLSFRDNFPLVFGPMLADEAYERYRVLYAARIAELVTTFPGVSRVLGFFHDRDIPLLIVTNKDRLLMERELAQLFDPTLFLRVVCGHEAERDKPWPEHIFYALDGLLAPGEISPENVWVIGDSHQDSNCALAANAQPIRIGQPIWHDEQELDGRMVYFNDFISFAEKLDQLEQLFDQENHHD